MVKSFLHWCEKPVKNKHLELGGGNFKSVVYSPISPSRRYLVDDKPFVCRVCGVRYSVDEIDSKNRRYRENRVLGSQILGRREVQGLGCQ